VINASNNSLTGLRDAINSAEAGVQASIINDGNGYRLVMSGLQTGAENGFTVFVNDTGDGDNTDTSGLSRFAFFRDAIAGTSTTNLEFNKAAGDANFSVNGLAVSSKNNVASEVVEGVTFTLKEKTAVDSPVTVTVSRDTERAKTAINNFVVGFNELTKSLNSLTSFDSESGKGSLLTGDSTLRTLARTVRSYMNAAVANGGTYSTLAELGITTKVVDGTLSVDSAKLQNILDDDALELARVLSAIGTPSNPLVEFVSSTAETETGTYSVSADQTNTAGFYTFANDVSQTAYNGGNNAVFSIRVDGGTATEITLKGNNGSLAALISEIETEFANNSIPVTVSSVGQRLTFTSNTTGLASSVEITAANQIAIDGLGISISAGTAGTSFIDYKINGQSVTESDGVLLGPAGTAYEGLKLKILGSATGSLGTVSFSRGVAVQVNSLIGDLLESDGLIEAKLDGLNRSIDDLQNQREALELRANALEKRYRSQFNGLETLIAQLNTTQTFLSQALSGFVEPNTTLRK